MANTPYFCGFNNFDYSQYPPNYGDNTMATPDTFYQHPSSSSISSRGELPPTGLPSAFDHQYQYQIQTQMLPYPAFPPPESPIAAPGLGDFHNAAEFECPPGPTISVPSSSGKKKLFACSGCDSVFERQSSLKQHILTHTGERPHQCDLCGRRFSIPSNLRRHKKSCEASKKRFEAESSTSPTSQPSADQDSSSPTISPLGSPADTSSPHGSRRTLPYAKPPPSNKPHTPSSPPTRPHASRRPSSARWLPPSLAQFANASTLSSAPPFFPNSTTRFTDVTIPLPPVRPMPEEGEERNSYQASPAWPYHPSQWEGGPLPGPGLLRDDELEKRPTVARRWMLN
ncbi:hypothetical protein BOTBODRAFT_143961 [Botryobasidium botryosum FD-172 SS1]|uniref:C2H2-type domain-containing protein n=1 Tax=Botryobasidium botryosum (strain FD-172 SS1) TaxID=930990 RepID=A0A067N1D4_BOTB1|nr:hypothetical protein BOTBODRAFT_143961 [Botryobasidium botryosum FD-172 SS1]